MKIGHRTATLARQAFEQVTLEVTTTRDAFARAASLSYLALALEQAGDVLNMEFAVWNYLTCAKVFEALADADRSRAAVEEGYHELITWADKISDSQWRASFIDNVPEHRAMIAKWQQLKSSTPHTKG